MLSPYLALCQHVQMCLCGDVERVEWRDIALVTDTCRSRSTTKSRMVAGFSACSGGGYCGRPTGEPLCGESRMAHGDPFSGHRGAGCDCRGLLAAVHRWVRLLLGIAIGLLVLVVIIGAIMYRTLSGKRINNTV